MSGFELKRDAISKAEAIRSCLSKLEEELDILSVKQIKYSNSIDDKISKTSASYMEKIRQLTIEFKEIFDKEVEKQEEATKVIHRKEEDYTIL